MNISADGPYSCMLDRVLQLNEWIIALPTTTNVSIWTYFQWRNRFHTEPNYPPLVMQIPEVWYSTRGLQRKRKNFFVTYFTLPKWNTLLLQFG